MNEITGVEAVAFMERGLPRLVVVVDTASGHCGVGEAGLTGRELAVAGAVEHLTPLLLGQDANRIEHLWQVLSRGGFFPADRVVSAALSAVDIALWDIKGKRLGVPVHDLLGGAVRDRVACYPHNESYKGVDGLLESCEQTVAAGWRFVRWGLPYTGETIEPGEAVALALDQMAAVRETFGDELEICFDVHTRLEPPDALRFCNAAERFRPYFIEDPLRVENQLALRRLRTQTPVPIAAGEQMAGKWELRALVEEQLVDFARLDLCIVGGITEARKIAGWCETHYIRLATHNPLGVISTAACLELNLATSNVGVQELPSAPEADDVFPVVPEWKDGCLLPTDRPGLGVEFDREVARARPLTSFSLPRLALRDGCFTNW